MNGDGNSDMLCGDAANFVYIFWRDAEGNVTGNEKVKDSNGNDIECGTRYSIPQLYDWNNDGLLDLLVGTAANSYYVSPHPLAGKDKPGLIWLYINTGSKEQYEFTFDKILKNEDGDTITSPTYSSFAMADLDGDSLADIITVGGEQDSTGHFRFWKNVGSKTVPKFKAPEFLRKENGDMIDYAGYSRFFIDDYNYDGVNDIVFNSSKEEIGGTAKLASFLWVSYGIASSVPLKTTGFNDVNNYSISFKQNKWLEFNVPVNGEYEFVIWKLDGKKVYQNKAISSNNYIKFDLSKEALSKSLYIFEIRGKNFAALQKIIIKY